LSGQHIVHKEMTSLARCFLITPTLECQRYAQYRTARLRLASVMLPIWLTSLTALPVAGSTLWVQKLGHFYFYC